MMEATVAIINPHFSPSFVTQRLPHGIGKTIFAVGWISPSSGVIHQKPVADYAAMPLICPTINAQ
jgi:hypothetical protein